MLINHIKKQKEEAQAEKSVLPPQTQTGSDDQENEEYSETASYVSEEDGEMFKTENVKQDIEDFLEESSPFQKLLFFMTQITTPDFREFVKSGANLERKFQTSSSDVKEFLIR